MPFLFEQKIAHKVFFVTSAKGNLVFPYVEIMLIKRVYFVNIDGIRAMNTHKFRSLDPFKYHIQRKSNGDFSVIGMNGRVVFVGFKK